MIKVQYLVQGDQRLIELDEGSHVIGRKKSCDVTIQDPSISGQHVRIDVVGGKVTFRDLLSRNGTYLNGQKVPAGELKDGDSLRLGSLEMRVGEPGTVAAPLDFAPSGGGMHDEVTPDDVPLAVATQDPGGYDDEYAGGGAARVVQVVQPDAPVADEKMKRQKMIVYGAAGLVVLVLAIMLMLPPPDPVGGGNTTTELTPKIYLDKTREGVKSFKDGNFAQAFRQFNLWQKAWDENKPADAENLEYAGIFASLVEPFTYEDQQKLAETNWRNLRSRLMENYDLNLFPAEFESFVNYLEGVLRREISAQDLYVEAEKLMRRDEFELAKGKYLEIPSGSLFYKAVEAAVQKADQGRMEELQKSAVAAAGREDFEQAIQIGTDAQKIPAEPDPRFEEKLKAWRINLFCNQEIDRAIKLVNSQQLAKIKEGEAIFDNLDKTHPANKYVNQRVPPYRKKINEAKYMAELKELYRVGDTKGLEAKEDQVPYNRLPQARAILVKFKRITENFVSAEAAAKKNDYRIVRNRLMEILDIESNDENAFHSKAASRLRDFSDDVVAAAERRQAIVDFEQKRFKKARERLEFVKNECKQDVSKEVEMIQAAGRKLYNEGLNAYHTDAKTTAASDLYMARDHFLPSEEWYKTINDRIRLWDLRDPRKMREQ